MTEFTASNGKVVREKGDRFIVGNDRGSGVPLFARERDALREFFQHERDEALGRWRWPENPDYIVYPHRHGFKTEDEPFDLFIVNELWGASLAYVHSDAASYDEHEEGFAAAGIAYFDAHPVRKPWHDAKPGDHWALHIASSATLSEEFHLFKFTRWMGSDEWYFVPTSGGSVFAPTDPLITAGRRIWPEATS